MEKQFSSGGGRAAQLSWAERPERYQRGKLKKLKEEALKGNKEEILRDDKTEILGVN